MPSVSAFHEVGQLRDDQPNVLAAGASVPEIASESGHERGLLCQWREGQRYENQHGVIDSEVVQSELSATRVELLKSITHGARTARRFVQALPAAQPFVLDQPHERRTPLKEIDVARDGLGHGTAKCLSTLLPSPCHNGLEHPLGRRLALFEDPLENRGVELVFASEEVARRRTRQPGRRRDLAEARSREAAFCEDALRRIE